MADDGRRRFWLISPAVDDVPRRFAVAAVVVRILVGLMWLFNVAWKRPPDFGQTKGGGLYGFTGYAVSNPVFPPFSWVIEHVVLPQFTAFGWGVLAAETLLAVALLSGAWVRLAALIGVAQSLAIGLSVAKAPNEWPWSYLLMVAVHLLLLFAGAGRYLAVDALRAGLSDGRALARLWGVLSVLMGAAAVVLSGSSPVAPKGVNLHLNGLEVGLGVYNAAGGVLLVLVGAGLLIWSGTRRPAVAFVTAVLAAAAGIVLTVQIGFSPPVLGGDATSAAFFFTLTAVALAVSRSLPDRAPEPARSKPVPVR